MKLSFWSHVRLAGAVAMIAGSFVQNLWVSLFGFTIVLGGTIVAVIYMEQKIELLEKEIYAKNNSTESN